MSAPIKAYAVTSSSGLLTPFEYDPGELRSDQVEIAVEYCGICHSDLSMMENEWGISQYPLVPGHEVSGRIVALGDQAKGLQIGQRVGLGWFSQSCGACSHCLGGDQNLCITAEQTIVARHGGFAERVRCHWSWAVPLPPTMDPLVAGPLFCGGITVFNPIVQFGVKPTDRVGVIGIGGLGHMALQFLSKWGCEVTAFTTSDSKREEAMGMGANRVVNTRNADQLKEIAGSLDFILSTVNVPLDWNAYLGTLAPKGKLHFVGAVLKPVPIPAMALIMGQRSVSGSPLGSPVTTGKMLEFCTRHHIAPIIETFAMSRVNDAIEHLKSGKARYRIVLKNDF